MLGKKRDLATWSRPLPHFVGRQREMEILRRQLSTAPELGGGLVLVSGEAGIGKSSLISAFCESVDPETSLILAGQCYDLSAAPPYGPWIEIFRQLESMRPSGNHLEFVPRGDSTDVRLDQSGLFENVHLRLQTESEVGTLIVVVEDIHWADPASLDLLRFVSRRVRNLAVMIIASYREDEVSRSHPLFRLLPAIVRESTPERIELRALARADIELLIARRYRLGAPDMHRLLNYLEKHAEGNPLFLHEVLRTLEAEGFVRDSRGTWRVEALDNVPLPMLIRQVIEERISRLPPVTTELLELASILGERVSLEIVKEVSQADNSLVSDAIEQAVEAHVLLESSDHGAVKFAHALIRQALYQRISLPRRHALHSAVGEYLSKNVNPDLDAVAFHFQQAYDDRAIEWLIQSGIRAHRSGAWFTAAERFLAASDRLESDEKFARGRGWLLHLAGYMLRYSTDSRTRGLFEEAERLAEIAGDPILAGYARHQRGGHQCMNGSIRIGLLNMKQGAERADSVQNTFHDAVSYDLAIAVLKEIFLGGPQVFLEEVESRTSNADPGVVVGSMTAVVVNWLAQSGRFGEALEYGSRIAAHTENAGPGEFCRLTTCQSGHFGLGHAYAALGNPERAQHEYATARPVFQALRDYPLIEYQLWTELAMVVIPYFADNLELRASMVNESERIWSRCAGASISHPGNLPTVRLIIDELEGLWETARVSAEDNLISPWVSHSSRGWSVLGEIARNQGRVDDAWTAVASLMPDGSKTAPGDSFFLFAIDAHAIATRLALDSGDMAEAKRWIEANDRWLEWSGAELWKSENRLLWSEFNRALGARASARDFAEQALEIARKPRQPLQMLAALRLLGELDTAERRLESAHQRLQESLALADACAAPFERALTLLSRAHLHTWERDSRAALAELDEVITICGLLGALPTIAKAEALAARLSANVKHRSFPAGLTPREVDVLRLMSSGRSNREIADELFISTRTVERHVANIYNKIHAHNRAEATAFALQHDVV